MHSQLEDLKRWLLTVNKDVKVTQKLLCDSGILCGAIFSDAKRMFGLLSSECINEVLDSFATDPRG
jgi:hypothetical protein